MSVGATCESLTVTERIGEKVFLDWVPRLRQTCVSLLAHVVFLISAFSSANNTEASARQEGVWRLYADRKYFTQCAEYETLRCYKRMLRRNPLVTLTESERVKRDLEGALTCLKNMHLLASNREMASILCDFIVNHNLELDPLAIGELLSVYESDVFNKDITEYLRETYVSRLDFADCKFDQALKVFVEESGFKMPVEKLKIERMLKAFCRAYDSQNPGNVEENKISNYNFPFD